MKLKWIAIGCALASFATSASAELPAGSQAPNFSTQVALAGEEYGFTLQAALSKGPVVLYFYPKAFTKGCTLEANAFAEAMAEFQAAGASVVGMSSDDIDTLKKFSVEECRDAFPVGGATTKLLDAYDVNLVRNGENQGVANRTSYVIAPDGRISFVHSDLDYRDHVRLSLEAVRALDD